MAVTVVSGRFGVWRSGTALIRVIKGDACKKAAAGVIAKRHDELIFPPPIGKRHVGAEHHPRGNDEHIHDGMFVPVRKKYENGQPRGHDFADRRRRRHAHDNTETNHPIAENTANEHGTDAPCWWILGFGLSDPDNGFDDVIRLNGSSGGHGYPKQCGVKQTSQ